MLLIKPYRMLGRCASLDSNAESYFQFQAGLAKRRTSVESESYESIYRELQQSTFCNSWESLRKDIH